MLSWLTYSMTLYQEKWFSSAPGTNCNNFFLLINTFVHTVYLFKFSPPVTSARSVLLFGMFKFYWRVWLVGLVFILWVSFLLFGVGYVLFCFFF